MRSSWFLVVGALIACDRGAPPSAPRTARTPVAQPAPRPAPGAPRPLVVAPRTGAERAAPPLTLTASDGSGLVLTRLAARATVEGPLAFTELRLDFHNPEARVREGTFAITLPAGATIARFAMEIDGRWQEAEVVARPLARRAYDDFLHRKQDPALLEQAAGNQFTARVFPIPAGATKHLIVSFSQPVGARPYTLPLRGLPAVDELEVTVDVVGADGRRDRQAVHERRWQPDGDVVVPLAGAAAVGAGELVVASVSVPATALPAEPRPSQVVLAIDTSASRALGWDAQVRATQALVAGLRARHGDALPLQVVGLDQEARTIYAGPAGGFGEAAAEVLRSRGAAGASSLAPLTEALAGGPAGRQLVLVTDAVWTAGPTLAEATAALGRLGLGRVDVVLAGGLRDEVAAAALVRAGSRAGDVHELDDGVDAVVSGLAEPVAVDLTVAVAGARWVWPARLPAARPGHPILVHARVADATRPLSIQIGAVRQTVPVVAATPALVYRAVAGAEIAELEARLATAGPRAAGALRDELTRRSTESRVLSSQTSFLVLETEADYARYHIDRSRRSVLVVDDTGLHPEQPAGPLPPKPPPAGSMQLLEPLIDGDDDQAAAGLTLDEPEGDATREQAIEEARAAGVLGSTTLTEPDGAAGAGLGGGGTGWGTIGQGRYGTIGHGSGSGSGYGVGGGRGSLRGRAASPPAVRIGRPQIQGELDKAIIRRYVRRAVPQLTYCYERALVADPGLRGAVSTRFTITPSGRVSGATAAGLDAESNECIARVMASLRFPTVRGGGTVQVNYPLSFHRPGTEPPDPATAPPADGPMLAVTPEEPPEPPTDPVAEALVAGPPALTGPLAEVEQALAGGAVVQALTTARAWHEREPGDVLAWLAFGRALEAAHDEIGAARAYGSLVDLFPGRADLRRHAAERLGHLAAGQALAVDSLRKAVADRPEHLTGHRLLAYALVRTGDLGGAFDAILAGVDQPRRDDRFAGGARVLGEDAGLIGAAWVAAGGPRARVVHALARRDLTLARGPSTRFVLSWETDGNDVDLHVRDSRGGHAYYSAPGLPSGGELYADVTTGYGPECFAIDGKPAAGPYALAAYYYARGPMGYGMGVLQVVRFDGARVAVEDRPFVIMNDRAMIDLGEVR